MAVTIVETVGGATSNSFVTLAETEIYVEARLNVGDWDSATDDTKNRSLVEATRELSARVWDGYRVTTTQALSWPRQWVVNPDDPNLNYYATDEIPQRVKDATMELALQFVLEGTTDLASLPSELNVKRKKVDVLETEYFGASTTPQGLARYPRVLRLIEPLLAESGTGMTIVRG